MKMIIVLTLMFSVNSYAGARAKEKKVDPKCVEFEKEVQDIKKQYKNAMAEVLKSSSDSEARSRAKDAERIQNEAIKMGLKDDFKSCPSFPPALYLN